MLRPLERLWALAGAMPIVLLLAGSARAAVPPSPPTPPPAVCQEPSATAAFLATYARGDEATAERLASPLYRAEWARVGVSASQRAALAPWARTDPTRPAVRLEFSYVDGVAAAGGFTRLLYAARATAAHRTPGLSVWRVDADPDGRVVWLALVWLFSDDVKTLVPFEPGAAAPPSVGRAAPRAQVRTGVHSASGPEGYYVLEPAGESSAPPTCSPGPAVFVAVDGEGDIRPGVWSYGQMPGPSEYGSARARPQGDPAPELAALRRAYLGTLP